MTRRLGFFDTPRDMIELPDRDDRHVLAAAIPCRASVIVTLNLGDFPAQALGNFNIEAQHPDDFVLALLEAYPDLVVQAAKTHRASLRKPPRTLDEYLAESENQGLGRFVMVLRQLGF